MANAMAEICIVYRDARVIPGQRRRRVEEDVALVVPVKLRAHLLGDCRLDLRGQGIHLGCARDVILVAGVRDVRRHGSWGLAGRRHYRRAGRRDGRSLVRTMMLIESLRHRVWCLIGMRLRMLRRVRRLEMRLIMSRLQWCLRVRHVLWHGLEVSLRPRREAWPLGEVRIVRGSLGRGRYGHLRAKGRRARHAPGPKGDARRPWPIERPRPGWQAGSDLAAATPVRFR